MLINEIHNLLYTVKWEFISRGNSRKGQYSRKRLLHVLAEKGFHAEPVDPDSKNSLIYHFFFTGTKNEILTAREEIRTIFRVVTQGTHQPIFKIVKRSD